MLGQSGRSEPSLERVYQAKGLDNSTLQHCRALSCMHRPGSGGEEPVRGAGSRHKQGG